MSENSSQKSQEEEIDLGQLFNAIGALFQKLFAFIGSILHALFKLIIYALKPLVNNFKIILGILLVFGVIGYFVEKQQKPTYVSDLLVRPYFDSKYQLANNIDYFNALIRSRRYDVLSDILEIDSDESRALVDFDIEIGPETKNEQLVQYDEFLKSIDSTLAQTVSFEDYVENRGVLGGTTFFIIAKAKSQTIFPKLEKGILKTFENRYSQKNKKIRDSSLAIQRVKLLRDLERVDSVQKIYLDVLEKQANKDNAVLPSGAFPLTQEKAATKEYELLQKETEIRNAIRELDEQQIVESDFYDVLSSFEEVGAKEQSWSKKYSIVFPGLAFLLMIVFFGFYRAFTFIKNYK